MKIKDVLQRDPAAHPLINQGQARITDRQNERAMQELHGELSTFVCEGQYAEGIQKIVVRLSTIYAGQIKGAPGLAAFRKWQIAPSEDAVPPCGRTPNFPMARLPAAWFRRFPRSCTRFSANWTSRANVPVDSWLLRGPCRAARRRTSGSRSWASCSAPLACPNSTPRHTSACGFIRRDTSTR